MLYKGSLFGLFCYKTVGMISELPDDYVSQLEVISQRLHTCPPNYVREVMSNTWQVDCHFGRVTTTGHGDTIKEAKRIAAEHMVFNVIDIYSLHESEGEVVSSMALVPVSQPPTSNPLGRLYFYERRGVLRNIHFDTRRELGKALAILTVDGVTIVGEGTSRRLAKENAAHNFLISFLNK